MDISELLAKYEDAVEYADIKINPKFLLFGGIAIALILLFSLYFVDPTLGFLLFVLVLDLSIGGPFYLVQRKIANIESRLPDVLHHIGTTLKTGGTIETALTEVSKANYGPITSGVKDMLKEMYEGKPFETAFSDFATKSKSEMLQRAAVIIIAAKKAGGSLLDTLTALADDIRALYRLKRERKTKTFMQFLFILVAGAGVAPFVFGIVKSVLQILVGMGGEMTQETFSMVSQFDTLFKFYVIVSAALTTAGAVQVREGDLSKGVVLIPIAMLGAYLIYVFVASLFISMLGLGVPAAL
ncbi:MAG: type II secretion system F family protein [archaeon]